MPLRQSRIIKKYVHQKPYDSCHSRRVAPDFVNDLAEVSPGGLVRLFAAGQKVLFGRQRHGARTTLATSSGSSGSR